MSVRNSPNPGIASFFGVKTSLARPSDPVFDLSSMPPCLRSGSSPSVSSGVHWIGTPGTGPGGGILRPTNSPQLTRPGSLLARSTSHVDLHDEHEPLAGNVVARHPRMVGPRPVKRRRRQPSLLDLVEVDRAG